MLDNATGIIDYLKYKLSENEFEMLRQIVQDKLNILLVSESKVDLRFPQAIFR